MGRGIRKEKAGSESNSPLIFQPAYIRKNATDPENSGLSPILPPIIPSLIGLTDAITERLDKAEAITRLLISEDAAMEFLPAAAWAIADLIHEARELYNQQWERIRVRG